MNHWLNIGLMKKEPNCISSFKVISQQNDEIEFPMHKHLSTNLFKHSWWTVEQTPKAQFEIEF